MRVEQGPRCLLFHPVLPLVYVSTQAGPVEVFSLARKRPEQVGELETGGRMCFLHLQGNELVGTSYAGGCTEAWHLDARGLPGKERMHLATGAFSHCACFDGDGETFFVPRPEARRMEVLRLRPGGQMEHIGGESMPCDIRHLRRRGDRYYGIAFEDHELCVMKKEGRGLRCLDTAALGGKGADISGSEVRFHPRLPLVYAASRGQNTVTVFSMEGTGLIRRGQFSTDAEPTAFCLDSEGAWLYIAGKNAQRVQAFRLSPGDGMPAEERHACCGREILWLETGRACHAV